MRHTRLILVEGIPGSGKSTLAHFLARQFALHDIAHRWCYEEDKEHPLYIFHDGDSLQQVLQQLEAGHYQQVIEEVLQKWRELVQDLRQTDQIVIIDGGLFGYLTWTLFPLDVPVPVIQSYLTHVGEIINELQPCLIYLYQDDIAATFRRIMARRGGETEAQFIKSAITSPYAQKRNLQGFDGMITFWHAYRHEIDSAFARMPCAKLAIENSDRDWAKYQRMALDFLELSEKSEMVLSDSEQQRFVGRYQYDTGDGSQICTIEQTDGQLWIDEAPHVWPHSRLIPLGHNRFMIESLPFEVFFAENANTTIGELHIVGPEQLWATIDYTYQICG